MKQGKVGNVLAIEIMCVECEEPCVDDRGSYMITEEKETVTCESCGETYAVPSKAFTPRKIRRSNAA